MHLVDLYGYPYEKRKGRPVHNFVRACILFMRGELRFKSGYYDPGPVDNSDLNELLGQATQQMQEPDPRDFKPDEHSCHFDVTAVKTCRACVDESRGICSICGHGFNQHHAICPKYKGYEAAR